MNNYSSLFQQSNTNQYHFDVSKPLPANIQSNNANKDPATHLKSSSHNRNTPNFASFNSITQETKRSSDISVLSAAIGNSLKSQCQIASAVADIGQFLKQMNESSDSSSYLYRRHLSAASNTLLTYNASNHQTNKPQTDSLLQSIIAKIEIIQSEIQFRLKEFEGWSQSPEFTNLVALPTYQQENNKPLTDISRLSKAQVQKPHPRSKSPTDKHPLAHLLQSVNLEKQTTPLPKANNYDAASDILDETPNMSKYYEMSSTENSRRFQTEALVSKNELQRPNNQLDKRISSRQNRMALHINHPTKLLPKENSNAANQTNTEPNIKSGASKKIVVPAIKLDKLLNQKLDEKNDHTPLSKKGPQLNMDLLRQNLQSFGQAQLNA